jgi:arabinan endo-1,5-alpha-L-arabinosidase
MSLSSYCVASTLLVAGLLPASAFAQEVNLASRAGLPLEQTASRGIVTRDPSTIVKCKGEFWVFYTGHGIPSFHSKDLVKWSPGPPVFRTAPEWIATAVPENRHMSYWAPDVIHLGNRYLLYYAVSSFGKITSAIGLATTPTLDPADPAYHWTDHGIVVQSREGGDFNAIDPSVFSDDNGTLWLSFGSYWSGIKLIQLDPRTGKRLSPDSPMSSLACNKSIEASCLYKHDGYYYLFVNWGSCCQGVKSTYNIRMGRSRKVTGPYIDRDGVDMLKGGGTLLLSNKGPLFGPGHAGILIDNGKSWFTSDFEGDTRMGGKATLAIMPLTWKSGWPVVKVVDQ